MWADAAHVGFYLNLQLRAKAGEVQFSQRDAAVWWHTTRYHVRNFMDYLERHGLIEYPEGNTRQAYKLRLTQPWQILETQSLPSPIAQATVVVPLPRGPDLNGSTAQAKIEKPAPKPAAKKAKPAKDAQVTLEGMPEPIIKDPPALQRLMEVLHKVGLHEAPNFTGKAWQKQAACVRRMIEEQGEAATESAIRGMRFVWPFDQPDQRPYDAFKVEKQFSEAVSQGDRRAKEIAHDQIRKAATDQRRESQQEIEAAHTAQLETWRARIRGLLVELKSTDPAQVAKIHEAAKQKARASFIAGREPPAALVETFALAIYSESVNDPAPARPQLQRQ
jgi:hypothetical protein